MPKPICATHVLPSVYDDSLSYYEVLCKLAHKVEELEVEVAVLDNRVTELENQLNVTA